VDIMQGFGGPFLRRRRNKTAQGSESIKGAFTISTKRRRNGWLISLRKGSDGMRHPDCTTAGKNVSLGKYKEPPSLGKILHLVEEVWDSHLRNGRGGGKEQVFKLGWVCFEAVCKVR